MLKIIRALEKQLGLAQDNLSPNSPFLISPKRYPLLTSIESSKTTLSTRKHAPPKW